MIQKIKTRTFQIIEKETFDDLPSRIFDIFILFIIFFNMIAVILETEKALSFKYKSFFEIFEIISVTIFTIEYLLRLWSCNINNKFKNPIKGRIKFALTPMLLVDLMAILPFYLPMILPLDLRFIRILRLFRIFRIFKIGRYSKSFIILRNVIKEKKEELFITIFVLLMLLVLASSLMYSIENAAQPDNFSSILTSMWWGVSTLTTVGYGDVYPITTLGKLLGALIAILGIGMFALPTGIIGSGFVEEIYKRKSDEKQIVCPHCNKSIKEENLK